MTIYSMTSYVNNGIKETIKTAFTPADASEESEMLREAARMKIAVVAVAILCSACFVYSFYLTGYSIVPLIPLWAFLGVILHDVWRYTDNMKTIAALDLGKFKTSPEKERNDMLLKNVLLKPLFVKMLNEVPFITLIFINARAHLFC